MVWYLSCGCTHCSLVVEPKEVIKVIMSHRLGIFSILCIICILWPLCLPCISVWCSLDEVAMWKWFFLNIIWPLPFHLWKTDIILPSQCDLDTGNIESMQFSCKASVYAERQDFSSELDTLAFKSVFSFVPIFSLKQTTQCYLTPALY